MANTQAKPVKNSATNVGEQFNMNNSTYPGSHVPKYNREWDTNVPVLNMQLSTMV